MNLNKKALINNNTALEKSYIKINLFLKKSTNQTRKLHKEHKESLYNL